MHVIVTGRNAKPELIEIADLVTEMELVKHPFRSGVKAQQGDRVLSRAARRLMIQGTGSRCRQVADRRRPLPRASPSAGCASRPFKPQNMSNNAAVAADGGEIGRAQALQARAARRRADRSHMNPVLLKPESETGAQVIVQGRRVGNARRANIGAASRAAAAVLESFARQRREADIVLVEGAGSPAEVNLRAGDIANMGFAEAADVPVVLVGDIDRGGVIASLVGTHAVLDAGRRARIAGFIINKFRGDPALFADGLRAYRGAHRLAGLGAPPVVRRRAPGCRPRMSWPRATRPARRPAHRAIAVPALPRIANFDDLDPLRLEPDVALVLVEPGEPLPATPTSFFSPARSRRSPISRSCARRAGTSTSPPIAGAAAVCSASAAAIRCSAARCATAPAAKVSPARCRGSGCCRSRPSEAEKIVGLTHGTERELGLPVAG